jgi:hypothetical protein
MDIQEMATTLSVAISEKTFNEPHFEVGDRISEMDTSDVFMWFRFQELVQYQFNQKFTDRTPLVFTGKFQLQDQMGNSRRKLSVNVSDVPGFFSLGDEITLPVPGDIEAALQEHIVQEADGPDDSDSGLPAELQSTGVQHIA